MMPLSQPYLSWTIHLSWLSSRVNARNNQRHRPALWTSGSRTPLGPRRWNSLCRRGGRHTAALHILHQPEIISEHLSETPMIVSCKEVSCYLRRERRQDRKWNPSKTEWWPLWPWRTNPRVQQPPLRCQSDGSPLSLISRVYIIIRYGDCPIKSEQP